MYVKVKETMCVCEGERGRDILCACERGGRECVCESERHNVYM